MARPGGSISLRLALSFSLVIVAFSAALLVILYHMEKMKGTSRNMRLSLDIADETMRIGLLAEEILRCQSDFIEAQEFDHARVEQHRRLSDEMLARLQDLKNSAVGPDESEILDEMMSAVETIQGFFANEVVDAKSYLQTSADLAESEQVLNALHLHSWLMITQVHRLNSNLWDAFVSRTQLELAQAQRAWSTSSAIARIVFPIAVLVSLLAIYYTHKSVTRPVTGLIDGTKALARGEFSSRIRPAGPAEFRELANGFNRMAQALATHQNQLVEAEKMAGVGRLSAGVAHEINNPLAVILGHARMLLAGLPDDAPEREQLETIAEEARLCKNIVDSLLDLSRPSHTTPGEVINPDDVMGEVLNMVQALQLTEGVDVEISVIDRDLGLTISRARLRQLALNIVRNALEALQDLRDGYLRIEGYLRPRAKLDDRLLEDASAKADSFLVLVFTDNGPGIPGRNLTRLFEPFYTTKATGTGLGLAISYNIVRQHGGFIDVQTAPAEGTTFTVGLPLTAEG